MRSFRESSAILRFGSQYMNIKRMATRASGQELEKEFFQALRQNNADRRRFEERIGGLAETSSIRSNIETERELARENDDTDLIKADLGIDDSDSDDSVGSFKERRAAREMRRRAKKLEALEEMRRTEITAPAAAPKVAPQKRLADVVNAAPTQRGAPSSSLSLSLDEVLKDRLTSEGKQARTQAQLDSKPANRRASSDMAEAFGRMALTRESGSSRRTLSQELEALEAALLPTKAQLEEKDEFLSRLQELVTKTLGGGNVAPFGSVVNGFWTPDSDIDICLQVAGCGAKGSQVKVLQALGQELQRVPNYVVYPRFGAAVPIINWAAKDRGGVSCDISVNNNLASLNSRLLGAYCQLDKRFRTLGFAIKTWAQKRDLNDRSRGTLSSFALILMLIHYLQRRPVPILPSLQDVALSRAHKPVFVSGVDCRYSTNLREIRDELEVLRKGMNNNETVGELMIGFFKYYGYEYRQGVVAIRDSRAAVTSSTLGGSSMSVTAALAGAGDTFLFIDNPFEVGKDVANVLPSNYARIRQEFRRAYTILHQGGSWNEVAEDVHAAHIASKVGGQYVDTDLVKKFLK